jgi:hypothetical protein
VRTPIPMIPDVFLTTVEWIWGTTDQAIVSFDTDIANFNSLSGMMFKASVGEDEYQPASGWLQLDERRIQVTMPLDATGINVDCSLQFDDGGIEFVNGGKLAGLPTYNLIHNGGARPEP